MGSVPKGRSWSSTIASPVLAGGKAECTATFTGGWIVVGDCGDVAVTGNDKI